MSDTSLNKIIQYGTAAARVAFTPNPAVGSQVLYIWYDTDAAPNTYIWNGSAWVKINPAGSSGASTTANYVVTTTEAGLPSSHILTGGAGIVITSTTGLVTVRNSATTQPYIVSTTSTTELPNSLVLAAGANITLTQTAGTVVIAGSASGASTTSKFIVSTTEAGLPNSIVLVAGLNVTFTTSTTQLIINAASGSSGASTTANYLVSATEVGLPNSRVLIAGTNVTFTTSTTQVIINASSGGGGGAAWTLIESRAVGSGGTEDFINLNSNELMVSYVGLQCGDNALISLLVSIDNGSSFLTASGNYRLLDAAGSETNVTSMLMSALTTGSIPKTAWRVICNANGTTNPKFSWPHIDINNPYRVNTTSAINAVRLKPGTGVFAGAGTIYIFGR